MRLAAPGASSGSGDREVAYQKETRTVRVRDRTFQAPTDRTLVLLIEDDANEPGGIRIIDRAVPTPIAQRASIPDADREAVRANPKNREFRQAVAKRAGDRNRDAVRGWSEALNADSVCREFISRG